MKITSTTDIRSNRPPYKAGLPEKGGQPTEVKTLQGAQRREYDIKTYN